ncbi:MAG: nitrous oxide reductase family maturation protein NosD [Candidatus Hermodarchaeota archaeon]
MKLSSKIIVLLILGLSLKYPVFNSSYFINGHSNFEAISNTLEMSSYMIVPPIHIDGNWSYTASNYTWCTGDGSWGNPYIIQGIEINGDNSVSCITIENTIDAFIIKNCSLTNSSSWQQNGGIRLNNISNGKIIENNCSNNNRNGIWVAGFNNTILDNIIENNNNAGIQFHFGSSNHTISGNVINYNSIGISSSLGENLTISTNTIHDNNFRGILLQDQTHSSIKNNVLYNNDVFGILLEESNENIIEWNEISSHTFAGITMDYSDWNIIANNTIYDNDKGISLFGSNYNDILDNNLDRNGIGMRLRSSSYNNVIENTITYYYECIWQTDCEGNYILDNDCELIERFEGVSIYGYYTLLVIAIIFVSSIPLLRRILNVENMNKKKNN